MISTTAILGAKVLIVDDQESGACALKQTLEESGHTDVSYTTNPFEVCELHRINRYKLILLDLQMPGMNGFQVMKGLSTLEKDSYLPVLAITAEPSYRLPALKAGAKDFICKPFDAEEVLTRVHNMLEIRLLHELAQNTAVKLEILAQQDPLTGLGNRRLLTKRISAAIANARRNQTAMAVVYLDLDGFKQINDNAGHDAGDSVLKSVARRLESIIREEDTLARVGGDEFMIALWHVENASDLITVTTKLIEVISLPYVINERSFTITTSAGVGIYPDHGENADSLMKSADAALYEAKRSGKNMVRFARKVTDESTVKNQMASTGDSTMQSR
jgi:two-component system, cell cycle response regulator